MNTHKRRRSSTLVARGLLVCLLGYAGIAAAAAIIEAESNDSISTPQPVSVPPEGVTISGAVGQVDEDVDKAWHAIHYTLNGKAWEGEPPLGWTVVGGTEIGEDVGYGPARYLTTDQVKAVAEALSTIDAEEFSTRFDPKALGVAEIYPEIWGRDDSEGLEFVLNYYNELRTFYLAAAERGDAALLYIN